MKLQYPFSHIKINQKFGENMNASYKKDGLLGHTGVDFDCVYGEPIMSCSDGVVVSIEQYSDPTMRRRLSVLTEDYLISYYHLSEISVNENQIIKAGDIIGKAGNVGGVFIGDKPITEEQRKQGMGTHLHLEVNEIALVKNPQGDVVRNRRLRDVRIGKLYIQFLNTKNGYGGCIDPMQFFPSSSIETKRYATIIRTPNDKETPGVLTAVNGGANFVCKSLELPWLNNARNISCIPTGTYLVKYTRSLKFPLGTYEIQNVPNRSGIRFHVGNYAYKSFGSPDIEGCIILGNAFQDINGDKVPDVINSTITVKVFEGFFGKQDFTLTIK